MDDRFHEKVEELKKIPESEDWIKSRYTQEYNLCAAGGAGRTQIWREGRGMTTASIAIDEGELEAIFRALVAPPLSWNVTLYVDSQSAIGAVRSEKKRPRQHVKETERQLVKMHAAGSLAQK
jgi:hypothetical protein